MAKKMFWDLPHPQFVEYVKFKACKASASKKECEDELEFCLRTPGTLHSLPYKGKMVERQFGVGHHIQYSSNFLGPQHSARVLIVSTSSEYEIVSAETRNGIISSEVTIPAMPRVAYQFLMGQLYGAGFTVEDLNAWYITPFIKFKIPEGVGNIPAEWKAYCLPFLLREISLIKPDYIVCVGSPVVKAFLGSSVTLDACYDQLINHTISYSNGDVVNVKVIALPGVSYDNAELRETVSSRISRQLRMLHRDMTGVNPDRLDTHHQFLSKPEAVSNDVQRVISTNQNIISLDLEWEGPSPGERNSYLLTLQYSTKPGEATVVELCRRQFEDSGCFPGFESEDTERFVWCPEQQARMAKALRPLFIATDTWKPRLGGHFLRADLPWLLDMYSGDTEAQEAIKKAYAPAGSPELCREAGGWDTSLMLHAVDEARQTYGLKSSAELLLDLPSWDSDLAKYTQKYLADNHLKKADLSGFGHLPPSILLPYAAWDADATRRLAELCLYGLEGKPALLDCDAYGNPNWVPYWRAHSASLAFMEMEETGFALDSERLFKLGSGFQRAYDLLLSEFRSQIGWETFNPKSTRHKQGLLFGRQYAVSSVKGQVVSVMPETAKELHLTPVYCTGSKTAWCSSQASEEPLDMTEEELDQVLDLLDSNPAEKYLDAFDSYTPAVDSLSMEILALNNLTVRMLSDICKLGTTLSGNIRAPIFTGDGRYTYSGGLVKYVRSDGHVHTRLSQTLKTGRLSSRNPNMQNIGKSAEADLMRILGTPEKASPYVSCFGVPMYLYPMRTVLKADEGRILMESDFTGAELAVMAWVSGDPAMIEHVRRNALSESDPDYYDIHSNIAVRAFHLDCPPTKHGLAEIGKKHLRVAAKAVVFGIPYGRGAKAIVNQLKGEGVELTDEEGCNLLQSYFDIYPNTKTYLDSCKRAVTDVGYVQSLFGRYRRFPDYHKLCKVYYPEYNRQAFGAANTFSAFVNKYVSEDVAKYGREACNAPIQSAVADAVNMALRNLLLYRDDHPELDFRLHMQIHDALVVSVPEEQAEAMLAVMQKCMVDDNPIVVTNPLTGVRETHHFAIESDLYYHWGEAISLSDIKSK